MLFDLGRSPRDAVSEPVALLGACHARIRKFCDLSLRLSDAPSASPEEVAEAAASLRRYFIVALPLHEADEEASIVPRLREAASRDAALERALDAMVAEHARLHPILADLDGLWAEVVERPADLRRVQYAIREGSAALAALFRGHLESEERIVFPALGALPIEERDTVMIEMRGRRPPGG